MTISDWLTANTNLLAQSSTTPRLDAEILLSEELGVNRAWLIAHPEVTVISMSEAILQRKISRRIKGDPLAYITGIQEFYGRIFYVDKNVLVPRPESESIINLLKDYSQVDTEVEVRIADVGAGSGCLGITAALELRTPYVDMLDIDKKTFVVSKKNARKYPSLRCQYYVSDTLTKNYGPYDYILANLPYVPDGYPVNISAQQEPSIALYAGKDGLDVYRTLFQQLHDAPWRPKAVVVECLEFQFKNLDELAVKNGFRLHSHEGLARLYAAS